MSDIIKNPNRTIPKDLPKYEPEYVRLGKEPVPMITSVDNVNLDLSEENVSRSSGQIIDNNDYVDFPVSNNFTPPRHQPEQRSESSTSPNVGDYILMVFGKIITVGSISKVEAKVKEIMYGEDKNYTGMQINTDDIVVLKRMQIKVGIFVENG